MDYLQKSSFNPKHLHGYMRSGADIKQMIIPEAVHYTTLADLIDLHFATPTIDLLVTDLEGREAALIPEIDFRTIQPTAIFYESHNLGIRECVVGRYLANNGYFVFCLCGDSFAVKRDFLNLWRKDNIWAGQNLAEPAFG